jgi:hypothetical protein
LGSFAPDDPDLASIIAAWPTLPAETKAGILAMVAASRGSDAR